MSETKVVSILRWALRAVMATVILWGGVQIFGTAEPLQAQSGIQENENGKKEMMITVGGQEVVNVPYNFGDVSIGSGAIVNINPIRDRRQILLTGRQVGSTSLIIWDTRGQKRDEYYIRVIAESLQRLLTSVQSLLSDVEGLRFRVVGDKILIEGEVFLEDEARRVKNVADKNPAIMSFVTLSPVTQRILAATVEKEIARPEITVRPVRDKLVLEGIVYSEVERARAEAIAIAYYANIVNVLDVRNAERPPGRGKTIVLIVHFVQLTKNLLNSWGFEWAPLAFATSVTGQYGTLADLEVTGFLDLDADPAAWTINDPTIGSAGALLLPKIRRARSSGYARVLENPTVSVKSGEEVDTFAGIQYPFAVVSPLGTSVEWKDIGVKLTAQPFALGDSVDMRMKIEVSELGQRDPVSGLPSIDTARIETTQYCKSGESIVIGGLHRLADSVVYNNPPGDVPGALVQLFKSKDYNKAKNQFLVFVTPQIHETSTTANKEIQEKFNLKEVKQ